MSTKKHHYTMETDTLTIPLLSPSNNNHEVMTQTSQEDQITANNDTKIILNKQTPETLIIPHATKTLKTPPEKLKKIDEIKINLTIKEDIIHIHLTIKISDNPQFKYYNIYTRKEKIKQINNTKHTTTLKQN